jgi:hypothetical protein
MKSAQEHIESVLAAALREHRRRKDRAKWLTWSLRIAVMFLGTATTIVLGISVNEPADSEYLTVSRNVALVLGALSTFLAGLASFWSIDSYWLKRKVILAQLESLSQEYAYRRAKSPDVPTEDLDYFFEKYQRILDQQTEYWESVLARTSSGPAVPTARQETSVTTP